MPYDEEIERRVGELVAPWKDADARRMFGGICHMVRGNMYAGVWREYLILRLGETGAREALGRPHFEPFAPASRPMRGWVMARSGAFETERGLLALLEEARDFALTLPPK